MGVAGVIFAGVVALAMPARTQAFYFPPTSRLSHQTTSGEIRSQNCSPGDPTAIGRAARPRCRTRRHAGVVFGGGPVRRGARVAMSAGEGGDTGEAEPAAGDSPRSQGEGPAVPVEPVGAAGAVEDDMLMEIVGQDYGMMALLRSDKFKSLIVLLRNIPAEEWVTEVAKAYPDDDEIKGMMGQVGKLMRMISYYEAKKPKK